MTRNVKNVVRVLLSTIFIVILVYSWARIHNYYATPIEYTYPLSEMANTFPSFVYWILLPLSIIGLLGVCISFITKKWKRVTLYILVPIFVFLSVFVVRIHHVLHQYSAIVDTYEQIDFLYLDLNEKNGKILPYIGDVTVESVVSEIYTPELKDFTTVGTIVFEEPLTADSQLKIVENNGAFEYNRDGIWTLQLYFNATDSTQCRFMYRYFLEE